MVCGGREEGRGERCEYPNKSHGYQEKENRCWGSKPKSLLGIHDPNSAEEKLKLREAMQLCKWESQDSYPGLSGPIPGCLKNQTKEKLE